MASRFPKLMSPLALAALALAGCPSSSSTPKHVETGPTPVGDGTGGGAPVDVPTSGGTTTGAPTAAQAHAFLQKTNDDLMKLVIAGSRADWVNQTYINDDTDALSAQAAQATADYSMAAIKQATQYKGVSGLSPDDARMLDLLRRSPALTPPGDPAKSQELAETAVKMQAMYGKGTYCSANLTKWATAEQKKAAKDGKPCLSLEELSDVLEDPKASYDQLVEAWAGWRTVSPPMKDLYARYAALGNEGAKEIGYRDVGDLWKSRYDMPAADMEQDVERLWQQVKPLYDTLHCYARKKLHARWGDKVPATGPMPAPIFGNMWSQTWGGIYDTLAPYPKEASTDVTKAMEKKKLTVKKMVEIAEGFFVSLGMPQLPDTFWQKSMFEKPRDRDVVCHASAWPMDFKNDVRIKMCTKVNEEDLTTLHHELGHDYYYLAYNGQPFAYQDGANDGFHEAIGDTIVLSMTPKYLVDIGILAKGAEKSNPRADLNALMRRALDKVAFLPFGLLIDKWRWDVFAGKTSPDQYNQAWWDLVLQYQGIVPPAPRPADAFDPGAKYHVPANTPYLRYFLADIYQFQFHRALCKAAGHTGPLYTCSIFGNKAAGEMFWKMLQMGASKPWPEAMKAVTGEDKADASAIVEYFQPLMDYMKEQTQGEQCGW